MPFIYCVDQETKNKLISKGYKLIKEDNLQNQVVWVFEYKPEIQFDVLDKNKCFLSNVMRF